MKRSEVRQSALRKVSANLGEQFPCDRTIRLIYNCPTKVGKKCPLNKMPRPFFKWCMEPSNPSAKVGAFNRVPGRPPNREAPWGPPPPLGPLPLAPILLSARPARLPAAGLCRPGGPAGGALGVGQAARRPRLDGDAPGGMDGIAHRVSFCAHFFLKKWPQEKNE